MLKLIRDCDDLVLPDAHADTIPADRTVMVQPCQPVAITRDPGDKSWHYLSGYDFTEGHDEWLPGHA